MLKKLLVALLAFVFLPKLLCYVRVSQQVLNAFNNFTVFFNKTYLNSTERDQALINFNTSFFEVIAQNHYLDLNNDSFEVAINHFSDMTLAQKLKTLNGFRMVRPRLSSSPSGSIQNFNDYGFGWKI